MDIIIAGSGNNIKSIITLSNYDGAFPKYCSRQLGAFSIYGDHNYEILITLLYKFNKTISDTVIL